MPNIRDYDRYRLSRRTEDLFSGLAQEPMTTVHTAVSPAFMGLESFSHRAVSVQEQTWEHLDQAQAICRQVKWALPYGSGNQISDVIYTQGESWARVAMLRTASNERHPFRYARLAVAHQAGNCLEMAATAFTLLAGQATVAPIFVAQDSQMDHEYVVVGDPRDRRWGEQESVVVDPWVTHPSALTLAQSKQLQPQISGANAMLPPQAQAHPDAGIGGINTITTDQVAVYHQRYRLPPIGPQLVRWLDRTIHADLFFNTMSLTQDVSLRYASAAHSSESKDQILQWTIDRQHQAQSAWRSRVVNTTAPDNPPQFGQPRA